MAKVYVFLADGFEEVEALAPVDILRRGGVETVMVSIKDRTVTGSHGIKVEADILFSDIDADSADMLMLPGGMPGTEHLRAFEPLKEELLKFNEKGKYIAAICAAPTVLGGLGILGGRKATCYRGLEDKLTGAKTSEDKVVVDGHIITSRGMGTAVDFGLKLLEIFSDKDTAEKMAKNTMCQL